jgi:hypothetical protein
MISNEAPAPEAVLRGAGGDVGEQSIAPLQIQSGRCVRQGDFALRAAVTLIELPYAGHLSVVESTDEMAS